MARRRGKTQQEGRREFLKLLPAYLAVGATVVGIMLTERREAARDMERRLDRLAARLDETARRVAAVELPPIGSGRPDPQ